MKFHTVGESNYYVADKIPAGERPTDFAGKDRTQFDVISHKALELGDIWHQQHRMHADGEICHSTWKHSYTLLANSKCL